MNKNRSLIEQALLPSMVVAFTRKIALILFAGFLAVPAFGAANLFWVGNGSSASAPAGGPWDGSTLDWSSTSTGSGASAWVSGDNAIFAGVDGIYGVSINTGRSVAGILFTNSGYTLSNTTSPETITVSTSGSLTAPNLFVDTGKTADIGTNITITDNGTFILEGNGTLNLDSGSICAETTSSTFGIYSNLIVNLGSGAVFKDTFVGTSTSGGIGIASSGGTAALNINGGTAFFACTNQAFGISGGVNANGALTINSGSFVQTNALNNKFTSLATGSGSTATINLNGGLLGLAGITNGQGSGIFNFNGGTLKAMSIYYQPLFWTPGTTVNVKGGGAVIDNNGLTGVTIGSALLNGGGADGGLIVTNSGSGGSLILTNVNTYNGPTVIKSGAYLATLTWSSGGGSYNVNDGGTLEVQVPTSGGHLAISSLTLGTSGNVTNVFTLGANASTVTPAVAVSGALTLNGTTIVNVNGSGLTGPNTYVLMSFDSVSGSGSFVAGTLPAVIGYNATLVETATQLELVYTAVPAAIKWAVGSGNWDTATANWQPLAGGSPVDYAEGAPVLFDDSASGTSPIIVTLTGNHAPNVITNNSTKNYIFEGIGYNLTGAPLIKNGADTLTIDNGSGNSFASITIAGGTLQIGNNDTNGSLGSGSVTDNGVLAFERTDTPTFANLISGSGSVTQSGSGTVTLSNTNTYTGSTTVSGGGMVTTTLSTGAGAYSVSNTASLSVQVNKAGTSLTNSTLNLGTISSDTLTNVFALGGNGSTTVPVVQVQGALTVNGTVTVNVTGALATGTYPLISYGSLSGSGSFVLGTVPTVATNYVALVMANNQLQLVYTPISSLTWDSGNTNNGATIDAGNGTWDKNPANLVWNFNGLNLPWQDNEEAIFAGADGSWSINLATNVGATVLAIQNSGYTFTAANPETITLSQGSGTAPDWTINTAGTATIGTNVTIQGSATYVIEGSAGGTLDIANGGTILETNASTIDLGGVLTYNLAAGGAVRATYVGSSTTGGFGIGVVVGDNTTLNVNGGTVSLAGTNNMGISLATGVGCTGTLTINSGTVSMAATNTVRSMIVASAAASTGNVNLNGGLLAVTCITNGLGTATVNFNGGTLEAVNGSFGPYFVSPFASGTANVLSGGALINNNGFNITVAQPLVNGGGIDGGLISSGAGSLTLTGANTYNGNTVVNGGRLALSGSATVNTASIIVAGGATFDVSALGTVTLASGQVLSNSTSTATVDGSVNASVGTISLTYASGTPSFAVTNGTLTLASGTTLQINNTSPALSAGSYELIAASNGGLITGTLPSFTVGGSGLAAGATANLQLISGNLYLVVSGGTPPTPRITSISVSGTTLTIMATNGADNGNYKLLESTNVALPLSQWQPVLTNTFSASGAFNLSTNIINPNAGEEFYILAQ